MKKEVLILGVGRALQMLLLFANYRLLTMVLPKEQVGEFFFILSLTAITGLVLINPIGTYFNRTLHSFEKPVQVKVQMLLVLFVSLCFAFLNFPIVALLSPLFDSISDNWLYLCRVVTGLTNYLRKPHHKAASKFRELSTVYLLRKI